jgi:hypothetical protein
MFFPAFASQDMFYDIEILDDAGHETGWLRSEKPVVFQAEIKSIPPLGTEFHTTETVDFFDVGTGIPTFRLFAGAPGLVTDAPGLERDLAEHSLDLDGDVTRGAGQSLGDQTWLLA